MSNRQDRFSSGAQAPVELDGDALDRVAGGADVTGRVTSIAVDPSDTDSGHSGGANFQFGDGSVRFVK